MKIILHYDYLALKYIQLIRFDFLDSFFYLISATTLPIAFIILILIGIQTTFRKKSHGIKTEFLSLVIIFSTSSILTLWLKYTVARNRPAISHPEILQLTEANLYSFPSGHTAIVFALYFGMLYCGFKKCILIPVLTWAYLVAYSRMILGAHYPLDVLTAITISFTISFTISLIFKIILTPWKVKRI